MRSAFRFGGRRAAAALVLAAAGFLCAAAAPAVPNLSGAWVRRGPVVDEKTVPPLTPEGQKQYAINKAGIDASDPKVDLILQCLPAGFPRSIESGQPFYIAQTPEAIAWIGQSGGRPQMIYMQNEHMNLWPFWMGDSIGRWEGDTLVVEVTGIITKTFLNDDGLPHSDVLKVTERIRLIENGAAIENRVRMEDPKILTRPWEFTIVYERTKDRVVESVCENTRLR
jgi:hypothetical protein